MLDGLPDKWEFEYSLNVPDWGCWKDFKDVTFGELCALALNMDPAASEMSKQRYEGFRESIIRPELKASPSSFNTVIYLEWLYINAYRKKEQQLLSSLDIRDGSIKTYNSVGLDQLSQTIKIQFNHEITLVEEYVRVKLTDIASLSDGKGLELPEGFPRSDEPVNKPLSRQERKKVVKMIRAMEVLNFIKEESLEGKDPLSYLRELIRRKYKDDIPTHRALKVNMSINGCEVSEKTISKYFKEMGI